jgi:NAD(P)-dependent dehydrogenase (short-subunit alcohol dehydrogenase family)
MIEGFRIVLGDGAPHLREALADGLRALGAEIVPAAPGDDPDTLGGEALSGGAIDAVVTLPGAARTGDFAELDDATWDAGLAEGLHRRFTVSRALAPHFVARGRGVFVHLVPAAAFIGDHGHAPVAAAGMAAAGLSRSIALDLAESGVRSNCLGLFDGADAAAATAFLLSEAASAIQGQILVLRGSGIHLLGQPRPLRVLHRDGGWRAEDLADGLARPWAGGFVPAGETIHDAF